MVPAFEGKGDRDARRQSWASSARANSGVSRTVRPSAEEGSGVNVPSAAAFGRLMLPTGSPGRRDRNHRSALDLPAHPSSRTEAAQEAPQQRLLRHGPHCQEPLDAFQPQTCVARPLVEFDPRRALLQQIGSRHDAPPRHRHLGVQPDAPINDAGGRKACEVRHIREFFSRPWSSTAVADPIPGEPDQLVERIIAVQQRRDLREECRGRERQAAPSGVGIGITG